MELCIVAIFKNEGHALKEWLDHYLKEGVDHFFLVDNGSTDGYDIQEYIKQGVVELWINPKKYAQIELTNHYLQKAKKYNWVLVVDLDEFMYARNGFKTIKEYLRTVNPEIEQIKVPWKLFGSSGHIKQPKSIIQGFTRRQKYIEFESNKLATLVKSLVRGKYLLKIGVHTHIASKPRVCIPNEQSYFDVGPVSEELLETSYLHLNHYRVQSWDFFKNVKMIRKSAYSKKNSKYRSTKLYFKENDTNDIIDSELKRKYTKKIK
jgi:hypothetical protein